MGYYLGMDIYDMYMVSRGLGLYLGMVIIIEFGIYIFVDNIKVLERFEMFLFLWMILIGRGWI